MRKITIVSLLLLCIFALACGRTVTSTTQPATLPAMPATAPPTSLALASPSPAPSPTLRPAAGLLYAPPDTAPWLVTAVENTLVQLAGDPVLSWETRTMLAALDLTDDVQLVIALPPNPGLAALVASAPGTQFLAIGIAGLQPAPNLIRIGPDGLRPDRQAFVAGYLAAVITEDWRVGVLSPGDSPGGRAARQGFINGVRFFCGLCLPEVPPYAGYPLFVDLQPDADQPTWQAAADLLVASGVKTVYLAAAVDQTPLREYLAENGITLVGSGGPGTPPAGNWAAAVRIDVQRALEEIWPEVLSEETEENYALTYILEEVNESLVTPGRQRLVESLIPDLTSGLIDTGIDPLTGENR